jgi:uncharacterized protein Smg (DUF494 family)
MRNTLVAELVGLIVRRVQETPEGRRPSAKSLRAWLKRRGFQKQDIDAALKLALERLEPVTQPAALQHVPRMLSTYEERKLTPQAREALFRLERYGLITPAEREMVLERLPHVEGTLDPDGLDFLLAWVVYPTRTIAEQQSLMAVLHNETVAFH